MLSTLRSCCIHQVLRVTLHSPMNGPHILVENFSARQRHLISYKSWHHLTAATPVSGSAIWLEHLRHPDLHYPVPEYRDSLGVNEQLPLHLRRRDPAPQTNYARRITIPHDLAPHAQVENPDFEISFDSGGPPGSNVNSHRSSSCSSNSKRSSPDPSHSDGPSLKKRKAKASINSSAP